MFTNPASASQEHARAYIEAILGLLGGAEPLAVLRATPAALREAVRGMTAAELAAREAPGKWACRHVLRHLADSEIVWGWRLRLVLAHDRPPLTGYDQDAWADRLGYGDEDAATSLDALGVLRPATCGCWSARLLRTSSALACTRSGARSRTWRGRARSAAC